MEKIELDKEGQSEEHNINESTYDDDLAEKRNMIYDIMKDYGNGLEQSKKYNGIGLNESLAVNCVTNHIS